MLYNFGINEIIILILKFEIEDTSVIKSVSFYKDNIFFIDSKDLGVSKLKAYIPSTSYSCYTNVEVVNPISFNLEKKDGYAILTINNYNGAVWSLNTRQAVEISVSDSTTKEEKTPLIYKSDFGT